jgi:hypothetical protein
MKQSKLQTFQSTPAIGAIAEGFDFASTLTETQVTGIRTALEEHLVLL